MEAKVTHAPVFAVGYGPPLPIDWLIRIEVGTMAKTGSKFDDLTKFTLFDHLDDTLRSGKEWEFAGASNDHLLVFSAGSKDVFGSGEVNTERLLSKQVLPGSDAVNVDLLVEIVGDGAVDGFDAWIAEKFFVVCRGGNSVMMGGEPLDCGWIDVRNGGDDRLCRHI